MRRTPTNDAPPRMTTGGGTIDVPHRNGHPADERLGSVDEDREPSGWTDRPFAGMLGLVLTAVGGVGILFIAIWVLVIWPRISDSSSSDGRLVDPGATFDAANQAGTGSPNPSNETPQSMRMIRFESLPSEADVYEHDKRLCTTPCEVEHPDYAPLARTFVLKAKGYQPTFVTVTDPSTPQLVRLKPSGTSTTRPAQRTSPGLDIIPER